MTKTTRAQRVALKRVWSRMAPIHNRMTYRQFRKTIQPTLGCDGAVLATFAGMWLCIERDGYTHS